MFAVYSIIVMSFFSFWSNIATGDGDNILRFCPSFHVVQLMKEVGRYFLLLVSLIVKHRLWKM